MQRIVLGDRYTLLEVLGDGGMARVYLANDNVLERDVALKVLRELYADDEAFVERFRREARSAAALNHHSIVQVYDQGRGEDGTYYIAMEYVPGGTLKERIQREGPLDHHEAAGIAARVAEALQTAHGRGIVHRDIKPQNVLLTASGEAKVADFGIARAASSKTVTETNLILGTSAYMSPEQAMGEPVGPASDLYSLGVVLYEMLTGEQPFRADDPIATAMKHLDDPPPHPGRANPAVPGELDALVVKLLAKNPEDRYASAAALAEDLRRVRDGLAPLGEGATTPLREDAGRTAPTVAAPARAPGAPARRRGLLPLIAALLVGVALLGGIAWALRQVPSDQAGAGGGVEVPGVVDLTREEAQRRLEEVGLEMGSQEQATSDEVAAGAVVEQDPRAGTEVREGTAVNLVLSTGPAQDLTTQASPSATSSASSSASSSATSTPPPAPPAGDEGGEEAVERQKELEEAARERAKELEEEQKKAEEEQREAAKEAERKGKKGR